MASPLFRLRSFSHRGEAHDLQPLLDSFGHVLARFRSQRVNGFKQPSTSAELLNW